MTELSEKKIKKSGSETRIKSGMLGVRVSPEERAEIEDAAAAMGVTVASYIRDCVLTSPQTKKTRKPSIERAKLAQVLGQLGKVKTSLDQIARRTNEDKGVGLERVGKALDDVAEIKKMIVAALKDIS